MSPEQLIPLDPQLAAQITALREQEKDNDGDLRLLWVASNNPKEYRTLLSLESAKTATREQISLAVMAFKLLEIRQKKDRCDQELRAKTASIRNSLRVLLPSEKDFRPSEPQNA